MSEVDELKAHVERLREVGMRVCGEFDGPYSSVLFGAISETPTQSLNHIKAQVEEETIQADMEFLDDMACEHSGNLNNRPRKYKEQSDED